MPVKNENKIKNDEHASSLNSKCERQAKRQACAFFFFFIFWILCEEHQAKGHAGALSPSLPLTWVHASSRSSMPVAGTLFLSQRALSDFLRVLADIVVGKVGTDLVLRNSLQQVCGEKNFTLGLLRESCSDLLAFSASLCPPLLSAVSHLSSLPASGIDSSSWASLYCLVCLFYFLGPFCLLSHPCCS